jgi:hypothetical protein
MDTHTHTPRSAFANHDHARATIFFPKRPSQPIGSRLTHGMSHAPQPQPLNVKATSSAFSQPTGSARRLTTALSLRRGSSFVIKNPAPSELDQKKKTPGLQRLVEEDAGNFEDNAGGGASADDRAAAADPTQPPESDAPVFKSERDAEIHGGSSSSPLRSPHIRQADNGSSPPRRVNFQVQSASGDAESAAAAPPDQLPSGGGSALSVVAVPPPITQSVKNAAALFKKLTEEKYMAGKGEGEGHPPGSRRNRPHAAPQSAAAPSAVAGDKSGWVDKMKKNFVGFFEGGDSDASTSDEEHEHERSSAAAAADDAPPSEVDAKLLPNIIAAIKAAQPPLVRTNTRRAFFGTETHPHSFKGCEFVDWLLDASKAGKLTVPSRARAVAIGEAMCSRNLMRGSEKGADFKDADVLYRCDAAAGASSRIAYRLSRCSLHAPRHVTMR